MISIDHICKRMPKDHQDQSQLKTMSIKKKEGQQIRLHQDTKVRKSVLKSIGKITNYSVRIKRSRFRGQSFSTYLSNSMRLLEITKILSLKHRIISESISQILKTLSSLTRIRFSEEFHTLI